MYYLDENNSLQESIDVPVYRVFGGDVPLEGSYVSDQPASDPINARWYNALSQHDFLDSDGNPIRNMASQMASGHISLDDEGHIIDQNTFKATDNVLEFTEVQPTSDLPGGGTEYQLQGDFNDLVVVDSVEDLRHEPTDGWLDYVEAEKQVLNGTYNPDDLDDPDDPYGGGSDDGSGGAIEGVAESVDAAALNDLIDDEEHDLQAIDVEESWEELIDEQPDDGMDTETAALDDLIEDTEYEIQAEDVEDSWLSDTDDSWNDDSDDSWDSSDDSSSDDDSEY